MKDKGVLKVYSGKLPRDPRAEIPEENLLIAQSEDGTVALYKLTTGEYQVNAGPDADGYVYVLIWTGIPAEDVYTRGYYVE